MIRAWNAAASAGGLLAGAAFAQGFRLLAAQPDAGLQMLACAAGLLAAGCFGQQLLDCCELSIASGLLDALAAAACLLLSHQPDSAPLACAAGFLYCCYLRCVTVLETAAHLRLEVWGMVLGLLLPAAWSSLALAVAHGVRCVSLAVCYRPAPASLLPKKMSREDKQQRMAEVLAAHHGVSRLEASWTADRMIEAYRIADRSLLGGCDRTLCSKVVRDAAVYCSGSLQLWLLLGAEPSLWQLLVLLAGVAGAALSHLHVVEHRRIAGRCFQLLSLAMLAASLTRPGEDRWLLALSSAASFLLYHLSLHEWQTFTPETPPAAASHPLPQSLSAASLLAGLWANFALQRAQPPWAGLWFCFAAFDLVFGSCLHSRWAKVALGAGDDDSQEVIRPAIDTHIVELR